MENKYFMTDQVKPKEKISFPGKGLLFMSHGLFISAMIVVSASIFYVK